MTVEKTQENLSTTLEKTEQALGGLETALGNNEEASLLATAENSEANDGLPEGWISTNIGDIASVNSGVGFPKKYQGHLEGDYPVYKVGDVSKAFLNAKGKLSIAGNYVSAATALEMKGKVFPVGATAFAKIGEAVRLNRRVLIQRQGLADNNVMVVKSDQSCMDHYVYQFLRTQSLDDVTQSTTVPSVRKGDIEELKFPLPPLAEQTVIAQTLDTLLAQVDNIKTRLDAIPKILKTFRQSVLAAAVSGKLTEEWRGENECESAIQLKDRWLSERFDKFMKKQQIDLESGKIKRSKKYKEPVSPDLETGPLEDFPDTWLLVSVSEFAECLDSDRIPVKKDQREAAKGLYPYFGANGEVDRVDDYLFDDELVMVTEDETFYGRVKPIAYRFSGKCWVNNHAHVLRAPTKIANDFLCFSLMFYKVIPWLSGTTGRAKLTQAAMNSLPMGMPPEKEQTQIVHRVEELFAFADQVEQQVKNAQKRVNTLTQSILAKAFRGELTTQWRAENPDLISGENSAAALLAAIKKEREALESAKKTSIKKTIKKKEEVAVKKPKAVVETVSAIARQNKQETPSKDLVNTATAISIEIPETDIQWSAFIRSHYKKSNPDLTLDELMAHLVQALSIKRLSPQRKALLEQVIKKACKWQVLYKESGVYCLYEVQFSDYDNEALDILLPKLLRKGSSASQDDLYKSYLQTLGFKRSSPKAEQRFKSYLRSALIRKVLQRDGDELKRV